MFAMLNFRITAALAALQVFIVTVLWADGPWLFGAVVGALMPIFIKSLGLDPAVASTPLIATLVDVTGMVIYFQIARAVLGPG